MESGQNTLLSHPNSLKVALGPLLFLLHIGDMPSVVDPHTSQPLRFNFLILALYKFTYLLTYLLTSVCGIDALIYRVIHSSGAGTGTADTANSVPLLTQARPPMRHAVPLFGRSVNIFNQFSIYPIYIVVNACHGIVVSKFKYKYIVTYFRYEFH